jgi:hypothetical protein
MEPTILNFSRVCFLYLHQKEIHTESWPFIHSFLGLKLLCLLQFKNKIEAYIIRSRFGSQYLNPYNLLIVLFLVFTLAQWQWEQTRGFDTESGKFAKLYKKIKSVLHLRLCFKKQYLRTDIRGNS